MMDQLPSLQKHQYIPDDGHSYSRTLGRNGYGNRSAMRPSLSKPAEDFAYSDRISGDPNLTSILKKGSLAPPSRASSHDYKPDFENNRNSMAENPRHSVYSGVNYDPDNKYKH